MQTEPKATYTLTVKTDTGYESEATGQCTTHDDLREALELAANRLKVAALGHPRNSAQWNQLVRWSDEAREVLASPRAEEVPQADMVLVPAEATEAMKLAAIDVAPLCVREYYKNSDHFMGKISTLDTESFGEVWRVMLAASPQADHPAAVKEAEPDTWQPITTAPKDGTQIAIQFESGNEKKATWRTTYGGEWHVDDFHHLPWADQHEILFWRPLSTPRASTDEAAGVPSVLAARGYVAFGAGVYRIQQTKEPGLVVTFRRDGEHGHSVGDRASEVDPTPIPAEEIIVRLDFTSEAGLDSLESHLREIRAEHWPTPVDASQEREALSEREFSEWLNANRNRDVSSIFHDTVAHYAAALSSTPATVPEGHELVVVPKSQPGDEPDWDECLRQCEEATGIKVERHTLSIFIREVRRWLAHRASSATGEQDVGVPEGPRPLPESMSRDEMLKYYSSYSNLCAQEALRYQQRIRELEVAVLAATQNPPTATASLDDAFSVAMAALNHCPDKPSIRHVLEVLRTRVDAALGNSPLESAQSECRAQQMRKAGYIRRPALREFQSDAEESATVQADREEAARDTGFRYRFDFPDDTEGGAT